MDPKFTRGEADAHKHKAEQYLQEAEKEERFYKEKLARAENEEEHIADGIRQEAETHKHNAEQLREGYEKELNEHNNKISKAEYEEEQLAAQAKQEIAQREAKTIANEQNRNNDPLDLFS